jgi:hypothetical protein
MYNCALLQVAKAFAINATDVARGMDIALDFSIQSLRGFDRLLESYLPAYLEVEKETSQKCSGSAGNGESVPPLR